MKEKGKNQITLEFETSRQLLNIVKYIFLKMSNVIRMNEKIVAYVIEN